MQWTYQGQTIDIIPEEYEGFVYLITNTTTGHEIHRQETSKV
jgi:hypothetical protein